MNVFNDINRRELLNYMSETEINRASIIPKYHIYKKGTEIENRKTLFYYEMDYSNQIISVENGKIIDTHCDCFTFEYKARCRHINAIIYYYLDELLNSNPLDIQKRISQNIFNNLKEEKKQGIKQLCHIDVDIKSEYNTTYLNLKIGKNKMYVLKPKINSFSDAYFNNKSYDINFGKDFVYNSDTCYFNEQDNDILEFALNSISGYGNEIILYNYKLKQLFKLTKGKNITFNNNNVEYVDDFDMSILLDKEEENYKLKFEIEIDKLIPLVQNFEYIYYDFKIIHVPENYRILLASLYSYKVNELLFDDIKMFKNKVLPKIKNNIELTDKIDNIIVVKKPNVKLYIDLNYNDIVINPKFDYKERIVSYFDNTRNISRDYEYENSVIAELYNVGFKDEKDKLIVDDSDLIGEFLENEINKFILKYEVFTSERIKKINIVKETHVKSTFSIGKDNIMKYEFDLGQIDNSELSNLFNSLKSKKKYFRLKNGNYLDLRDENINELGELYSDLNLKSKNMQENSGVIPKYKALYLDSLKNNKYHIINTNSLFDKFIDNFKNYKNVNVIFDKQEDKLLRDYQMTGVKWMYNIYKCDLGGILADEMGLGKSFQSLSFIKKVLNENFNSKVLIVTPTSLCYNWEKEIQKFYKKAKYHVFSESRNLRRKILENLDNNIYITSYGLLREDIEYYKKIDFEVFIIDEAQNIKNPSTGITKSVKEISARTKFALTGTPLENSLIELWSIFDFIMPGFFGSNLDFNNKYNIKDFTDENVKVLNNLNKQISPFILRRKKKDVMSELPPKTENNIYIDLTDDQKQIYAEQVRKTNEEMDELLRTQGFQKSRFKILELITRLRQLCIDPRIVFENYNSGSAKIEEAVNVIKSAKENGHKMLLFSSFRTALDLIEQEMKKNNISYYLIDGQVSSKKRMELVDKFNNDSTDIFLIMLKAGGTGLNLTSADVVIHLDLWWNPAVENQATDRAHRIGQTKNVEIIKLISKGTIEERILELQEKKKRLSDSVIEGESREQNLINTLTEEDLKALLINNNK